MIIDFRGWNENEQQMYDMSELEYEWDFEGGYYDSFFRQDHWISMLNTRLKDINNKPIFEGDIVKQKIKYDPITCEVVYSEKAARFGVRIPYTGYIGTVNKLYSLIGCEVIGNIYEHPHLLKETK